MTRSRAISSDKYHIFLEKAEEFYAVMNEAYERGQYSPCVSSAVHCAICAIDSFTIKKLGKRSAPQNHFEAVFLFKEAKSSDDHEKANVSVKFHELLEFKAIAEYEDRLMSKADAEKARNLCDKIYSFIKIELQRSQV